MAAQITGDHLTDTCIIYGALISFAVSLLKRIPFVGKNPKIVATVIALVVNLSGMFLHGGTVASIADLVRCVGEQLAVSVATYEVITANVVKAVKGPTP